MEDRDFCPLEDKQGCIETGGVLVQPCLSCLRQKSLSSLRSKNRIGNPVESWNSVLLSGLESRINTGGSDFRPVFVMAKGKRDGRYAEGRYGEDNIFYLIEDKQVCIGT